MRTPILALVIAFSWLGINTGTASEKVWVGLYLAENAPPEAGTTAAPEKLRESLREVFGFKNYVLIKSGEIKLRDRWEHWVVPRKDFFIRVEPLPWQPGEQEVIDYEIYKDGFIVAKGQYEPHQDTPLFINGPDFKKGRFVFVLEAR
ncbi:MAG: hypothetical protein LV479_00720 [Methylacidiphilales bacterium]|nr:hypothetical protein [Candidatus Methylacidiphilales bacterium]